MAWERKATFPVLLYFSWRLVILFYQVFFQASLLTTEYSQTLYQKLFLSWVAYWDSGHFAEIVSFGYRHPEQVYFPLWPILIKTLSVINFPVYASIYLLSFALGILVFILFYNLSLKLLTKNQAKMALLLFTVFPSTMFLHAGYSEILFLTLSLSSFLFLEKKNLFLASLISGLATMTRLAGIGLAAALIFAKTKLAQRLSYASIALSGLMLYMLYLQVNFNNPLYFFTGQEAWQKASTLTTISFPLTPLLRYTGLLLLGWAKPDLSATFIDWATSVTFLLASIKVYQKLGKNYFTYAIVVILLPLFSGTFIGMVRYVLVAFPIFMILPSMFRSRFIFLIFCLLLFLLQLRFITLFTNLIWVA